MEEQMNEVPESGADSTNVNPGNIRKSTIQSVLKTASAASGLEFNSIEDLAAALARLSAQQSSQPVQQTVQQDVQQSKRITTNDLQEQFVSLKQDLAKKEQILRERELDGEIRNYMGSFDPDLVDYALSKVRSNIQWDTDGSYAIVNSKGQMRFGEDGQPMSIEGLVKEVAKANPKLLRRAEAASGGSGIRPQTGLFGGESESMPDYNLDPAGFKAWAQRNGLGRGTGLKAIKPTVTTLGGARKIV